MALFLSRESSRAWVGEGTVGTTR